MVSRSGRAALADQRPALARIQPVRPLVSFGHPVSQAPGTQVLPGPEDGTCTIETVTDEIDAAGTLNNPAVFVSGNLTDLP